MNPAHLHLLLNHVPVLGTAFGVMVLAWALFRRNRTLIHLAYVTFIATALVAVPVFLTGEEAEDMVEGLPGVTDYYIERHEGAASIALAGSAALSVLSLAAAYHSYRTKRNAPAIGIVVLLASMAVAALMARTANLGGEIRHTEIRSGAAVQDDDDSGRRGRRGRNDE